MEGSLYFKHSWGASIPMINKRPLHMRQKEIQTLYHEPLIKGPGWRGGVFLFGGAKEKKGRQEENKRGRKEGFLSPSLIAIFWGMLVGEPEPLSICKWKNNPRHRESLWGADKLAHARSSHKGYSVRTETLSFFPLSSWNTTKVSVAFRAENRSPLSHPPPPPHSFFQSFPFCTPTILILYCHSLASVRQSKFHNNSIKLN